VDVLRVFISCGAERNRFRNAGVRVISRLNGYLVDELGTGPILLNWDYRRDLPRDVPSGEFERRSLEIVDLSNVLIGVLGADVPALTRKEILRAYERSAAGQRMSPFLLADPSLTGAPHNKLLQKVQKDYDRDVLYGHYHTTEDLIHMTYLILIRYLRTSSAPSP
jgi:hypothetical protein